MTTHLNTTIQHGAAAVSIGGYTAATFFHYLPSISLVLSSVAATLSIVTMLSSGISAFFKYKTAIKTAIEAERIKAQTKIAQETVKAQAKVVATALDIKNNQSESSS